MGIHYEWADDRQIIMNIVIEFPWSWKDYMELTEKLFTELRNADHPCATVVDTTHMGSLPKDGNAIQILINVDKSMPDNVFASVIVGAPMVVSVFMNMLTKLRPRAQRLAIFTNTREEAYQKIMERYDSQFPDRMQEAKEADLSGD